MFTRKTVHKSLTFAPIAIFLRSEVIYLQARNPPHLLPLRSKPLIRLQSLPPCLELRLGERVRELLERLEVLRVAPAQERDPTLDMRRRRHMLPTHRYQYYHHSHINIYLVYLITALYLLLQYHITTSRPIRELSAHRHHHQNVRLQVTASDRLRCPQLLSSYQCG